MNMEGLACILVDALTNREGRRSLGVHSVRMTPRRAVRAQCLFTKLL